MGELCYYLNVKFSDGGDETAYECGDSWQERGIWKSLLSNFDITEGTPLYEFLMNILMNVTHEFAIEFDEEGNIVSIRAGTLLEPEQLRSLGLVRRAKWAEELGGKIKELYDDKVKEEVAESGIVEISAWVEEGPPLYKRRKRLKKETPTKVVYLQDFLSPFKMRIRIEELIDPYEGDETLNEILWRIEEKGEYSSLPEFIRHLSDLIKTEIGGGQFSLVPDPSEIGLTPSQISTLIATIWTSGILDIPLDDPIMDEAVTQVYGSNWKKDLRRFLECFLK